MARLSEEAEKEIDRLCGRMAEGAQLSDCLRAAMVFAVREVANGCRAHSMVGGMVAMGIEAHLNQMLAR